MSVIAGVQLNVSPRVRRLDDGRVDLGPAAGTFPRRLEVDGTAFYLTSGPDGYRLLSGVCPHLGSEIADVGDCFECPNHGWRFDSRTGKCLTSPGQQMASTPVRLVQGRLIADLPAPAKKATDLDRAATLVKDLSVLLHAHACLEFKRARFSLLTDPWLHGPAFLGAWTQYPPTVIDPASLRPDAIWISHEHSDHFHEPTLNLFARDTPIYFPDFPNRRIADRLAAMQFTRAIPMRFGEATDIGGGIRLSCYEPGSLWNDAVALIEVDGFRFLNLNDAGLNRRIARAVGRVDAIASSFSPGASGYPLTWTHLDTGQKQTINERARKGILEMLKQAVELYGGRHVLPFAGHFALWHPSHRPYAEAMRKNTVDDVVAAFAGSATRVVDLLPGERWDVAEDQIARRWKRRSRLYESGQIAGYVGRKFDASIFAASHPSDTPPTLEQVSDYLLRLNQTTEMAFCEDLTVTLQFGNTEVGFEISGGHLRLLKTPAESPNLNIRIPAGVLRQIIVDNLSWDEAHIGYWCEFSRQPDVFHAGFWRLLQAPYFAKSADLASNGGATSGPITDRWIIADVLEKFGEPADRIVRRYGLYCSGCQHSTADTLAQGASQHGLDEHHLGRLVLELNQSFHTAA